MMMIKFIVVVWMLTSSVLFAKEKLIFAIDVVRHGDRTPVMESPAMHRVWSQGPGQLTPKGMRQEHQLGVLLRQQYVNQVHLLPSRYDIKTMRVRSSNMDRTLMSTQSLLQGLYPQGFQSIPIVTLACDRDSLLLPLHDVSLRKKVLEKTVLHESEWVEYDKKLKSHYALWSKKTGVPIRQLLDIMQLSDKLRIERWYGVSPPPGLDKKEVDLIIHAGEWAFLRMANHPVLARMTGLELAQTIKQELVSASERDSRLHYVLFMAHDTTLAPQLQLLGQTLHEIPPYASILHYALFDTGSSHYEVRVSFNHKPLVIPACGGNSCSLSQFIHLVDDLSVTR